MTQAATETGTGQAAAGGDAGAAGQAGAAGGTAGDAGQQGAAAGQAAAGAAADAGQGAAGQQAAAGAGEAGTGQAAAGTNDDGLTDAERSALTDPGRRAIERIRGERDTTRTELETTRTQLTAALARINDGSDQTLQTQVTEQTQRADGAVRQLDQVQAVLRNGLAKPVANETGEQFAARVVQLASMLQGADAAGLDASAQVLASLGGGQQQTQRVTTGDAQAAGQGAGQAGAQSMDDMIRAAAGRPVNRG